jgi:septum formation protein
MIVLASASPRRCQLLHQIGVEFRQVITDIPEIPQPGEAPEDFVQRLALDKARAGLALSSGLPVLGADTEVVLHGEIFGKPTNAANAARMLGKLAGQTHTVLSAVALSDGIREAVRLNITEVRFATLDEAEINAYIATGEPFGKAGGYAIQGRAAMFIESITGSYSGVMGLPLYETAALLRAFRK